MDAWTKGNVRRTLGKTEKNSMLVICKLSNRTELSSLYLRSSKNGRQICHPRYLIQWHFLLRCTVGNILWKSYIFSWMGAAPVNNPRPKKTVPCKTFFNSVQYKWRLIMKWHKHANVLPHLSLLFRNEPFSACRNLSTSPTCGRYAW